MRLLMPLGCIRGKTQNLQSVNFFFFNVFFLKTHTFKAFISPLPAVLLSSLRGIRVGDDSPPELEAIQWFFIQLGIIKPGIFLQFRQIFVNGGPTRVELVVVAVGLDFKKIACVEMKDLSRWKRISSKFSRLNVLLILQKWRSTLVKLWQTKFVIGLVACWNSPTQTTRPLCAPFGGKSG